MIKRISVEDILSNQEFKDLFKKSASGFKLGEKIDLFIKDLDTEKRNNRKIESVAHGLNKTEISNKLKEIFKKLKNSLYLLKNNYNTSNYDFFTNILEKKPIIIKGEKFYICEFCGETSLVVNKAHVITRYAFKKNNRTLNHNQEDSIFNKYFLCANCHDITERKWNKAKKFFSSNYKVKDMKFKIPPYGRYMRNFKRRRLKANEKIIKKLDKDLNRFTLKLRKVKELNKRFEKYKKEYNKLDEGFNYWNKICNKKINSKKRIIELIRLKKERGIRRKYNLLLSKAKSHNRMKQLRKNRDREIIKNKLKFNKSKDKLEYKEYKIPFDKQIKNRDKKQTKLINNFSNKVNIILRDINNNYIVRR